MTEFTIAIAGVRVQVRALYESTKRYCQEYLTEEPADFSVEMEQADLVREQEYDDREAILEGRAPFNRSANILETTALYRKIVNRLTDYNVLLFHGSVVAVDGQAYMFTAVSGTGKSTHTRLWRERFGQRAVMINDDKPLLKITPEGVLVCGTPWDGKHRLNTNCMVPLKAVCVLHRGQENEIHALAPREALPILLQQSHRPTDMLKYMELMDAVTTQVRFYSLHCNMEPQAAQVAYEGMQ